MMDSSENSLEGWVAVKRNIFMREGDTEFADSSKIKFLVAYNSIEHKLAITCIQGSRKASDVKPKSMACSIRYVFRMIRFFFFQLKFQFSRSI